MLRSYFSVMAMILIALASCKKEKSSTLPAPINKVPVANAGHDTTIYLPIEATGLDIMLNGSSSYDSDGTINIYLWRKIQGPGQVTIDNYQKPKTSVFNLIPGIYSFELEVTDNSNLVARDTIIVSVESVIPDQTSQLFNQLEWTDSCFLKIENIYSYLPSNATFRVYVRYETSNTISFWRLVEHSSGDLSYEIVNGEIRVHDKNVDCAFDTSTYDILIDWD